MSREQFEKWYQSEFKDVIDFSRMPKNNEWYDDSDLWDSWVTWQACQELNNKRIAELEAKLKVAKFASLIEAKQSARIAELVEISTNFVTADWAEILVENGAEYVLTHYVKEFRETLAKGE